MDIRLKELKRVRELREMAGRCSDSEQAGALRRMSDAILERLQVPPEQTEQAIISRLR
jgi:hypothetical protein